MDDKFKMRIIDGYDYIISEKGNTYTSLRKIVWGNKDDDSAKYDLRKYYTDANGEEKIGKGVSFDEEGANELTRVLIETGQGNTREIIDTLRTRDDFESAYNDSINNVDTLGGDSDKFVDIRSEMLR